MKMLISNLIPLLLFLFGFHLQSCEQGDNKINDTYSQILVQKIDYADSIFVLHTLKELSKLNWWTFQDYSKMYKMENKDVEYFIERVFYNSEKRKMIVWYCEKSFNASTIEDYSDNPKNNRRCPNGGDTIYSMGVLIGFRDSLHQPWNLYPFGNQSVVCSPSKEVALNILGQYYFDKMKNHEMWRTVQDGPKKGELELKTYGYNIQDKDFWDKCWLWEKDTIGSNGLYPFQVEKHNNIKKGEKCYKCAKPFDVPKINYPEEILKLFR